MRFALTGAAQEWMDPQSCRLQFDINETGAANPLKPLSGPWCLIQRVSVRVLGTLCEDITMYGRCYEQFFQGLSNRARQRELDLGFVGEVNANGDVTMEPIAHRTKKAVTMNLLCGLFSGQSKYLWLSAMGPITIEIELAEDGLSPQRLRLRGPRLLARPPPVRPGLDAKLTAKGQSRQRRARRGR